jgi:hypothetical protein
MKHSTAKFWADAINRLLAGNRAIIINVFPDRQPSSEIVVVTEARAFEYSHLLGEGHFHIVSSWGVHDGFETVRINPDTREIAMLRSEGPDKVWRILRDLNEAEIDYQAWHDICTAAEAF